MSARGGVRLRRLPRTFLNLIPPSSPWLIDQVQLRKLVRLFATVDLQGLSTPHQDLVRLALLSPLECARRESDQGFHPRHQHAFACQRSGLNQVVTQSKRPNKTNVPTPMTIGGIGRSLCTRPAPSAATTAVSNHPATTRAPARHREPRTSWS